MKVTRDKTLSVDLGNGLMLERHGGNIRMYFNSSADSQWVYLDSLSIGINDWAEEQLSKHFNSITITLETEDEACTLWHLLNTPVDVFIQSTNNDFEQPGSLLNNNMWKNFDRVYRPKDAQ